MNGLIYFLMFSFLLQSFTNITLILFIKKWMSANKQVKFNLNHIFEEFTDEHIQSQDR